MKKIVAKYPVIVFALFTFILVAIIGLINMEFFPSSFKYALMFPQWAPGLAAVIVVGIINGKTGIFSLLQKVSIRKSSVKWVFIAATIPAVCCIVSYIALLLTTDKQLVMPTFTRSIGVYIICFMATLFGSYGEEIGWRGFMLPQFNKRYPLFISSVMVGLFWAFWHVNLLQLGLLTFGLFALSVISFSILFTWLCSKTKNNIFVAIIFHTIFNMCTLLLFENVLPDLSQMQTGVPMDNVYLYTILYGIYAVVFVIASIFIVKNLLGKRTIHQIE
jgi:membrane protease YdiL (CAAX protease family)